MFPIVSSLAIGNAVLLRYRRQGWDIFIRRWSGRSLFFLQVTLRVIWDGILTLFFEQLLLEIHVIDESYPVHSLEYRVFCWQVFDLEELGCHHCRRWFANKWPVAVIFVEKYSQLFLQRFYGVILALSSPLGYLKSIQFHWTKIILSGIIVW